MSRRLFLVICLFAAGAVLSCTSLGSWSDRLPLEAETLYKGVNCGECKIFSREAEKPAAAWITDAESLEEAVRCMDKSRVPYLSRNNVSETDFATHGILYVRMGRKPTGGYGLELPPDAAVLYRKRAVVSLTWIEPAPGAIVTQAITQPCILIKLPRKSYESIEVRDSEGSRKAVLRCRTS